MATSEYLVEKIGAECFTVWGVCLLPHEAPQDHCAFNSARNGLFCAPERWASITDIALGKDGGIY